MALTYGILDALSFTVAARPRAAKNPSPPHSQASASYYSHHQIQNSNQPKHIKSNLIQRNVRNIGRGCLDQVRTLPMCGARRSTQGSGKGVPLSHTSSSFTGSCNHCFHTRIESIRNGEDSARGGEESQFESDLDSGCGEGGLTGLSGTMWRPAGRPMPARCLSAEPAARAAAPPPPPRMRAPAAVSLPAISLSLSDLSACECTCGAVATRPCFTGLLWVESE
jgi:hypothetical protein